MADSINEMDWTDDTPKGWGLFQLFVPLKRAELVVFFLELGQSWDGEDAPLSKQRIRAETGMAEQTLREHLGALEILGVINEVSAEETRWPRFAPAVESDVFRHLTGLETLIRKTEASDDVTED